MIDAASLNYKRLSSRAVLSAALTIMTGAATLVALAPLVSVAALLIHNGAPHLSTVLFWSCGARADLGVQTRPPPTVLVN